MALPRMLYPDIAARIDGARLTRAEVARELGLTMQGLRNKLNGQFEFTLTEALALARLLGVGVEEMAGKPAGLPAAAKNRR